MFLGATSKILNQIAVDFTTLINLDTLLPHLLQHQLLTDDEVYEFKSEITPPSQRAQELFKCLKAKGDEVILKLLCSLSKETTHAGHKDIVAKLMNEVSVKIGNDLMCPTCNSHIPSDALDEVMDSICTEFPPDKWEELADALQCNLQVIQQIKELADGAHHVKMLLQLWRKDNKEATEENLTAKLRDANLLLK